MEEARRQGVSKFVALGTICSYPKHTPVPFRKRTSGMVSRGDQRALRPGEEDVARPGPGVSAAIWFERHHPFARESVRSGGQFRPDHEPCHPALIRKAIEARENGRKHIEAWGTGSATREFLFVGDAADAIVLAAEKYDKPEPLNIGADGKSPSGT